MYIVQYFFNFTLSAFTFSHSFYSRFVYLLYLKVCYNYSDKWPVGLHASAHKSAPGLHCQSVEQSAKITIIYCTAHNNSNHNSSANLASAASLTPPSYYAVIRPFIQLLSPSVGQQIAYWQIITFGERWNEQRGKAKGSTKKKEKRKENYNNQHYFNNIQ